MNTNKMNFKLKNCNTNQKFLIIFKKKPSTIKLKVFKRKAVTYSPTIVAVPSALIGLTSLFGMGRGEPYRYNHLKLFGLLTLWVDILKK